MADDAQTQPAPAAPEKPSPAPPAPATSSEPASADAQAIAGEAQVQATDAPAAQEETIPTPTPTPTTTTPAPAAPEATAVTVAAAPDAGGTAAGGEEREQAAPPAEPEAPRNADAQPTAAEAAPPAQPEQDDEELNQVPSKQRAKPILSYMILGAPAHDDMRSEQVATVHIEHCRDCDTHAWCTRHDEEKYKGAAAELCQACELAFPNAKVLCNDKRFLQTHGEGVPRIGAFEVVVDSPTGVFLVNSKVLSNRWPRPERVLTDITEILERNHKRGSRTLAEITDASSWTEEQDAPILTARNAAELLEVPTWLSGKPQMRQPMNTNLMPPLPSLRFKRCYLDQLTMGARLQQLGVSNPAWRPNGRLDLRRTANSRPHSAMPSMSSGARKNPARPMSALPRNTVASPRRPTSARPQSAVPGRKPPAKHHWKDEAQYPQYSPSAVDAELKELQKELDALK